MQYDINVKRPEVISTEEYLRKRKLIKEKEKMRNESNANSEYLLGRVMELAELMYIRV